MKVFAISDLHLSTSVEKPMNIFGEGWDNHFAKISEDWNKKVSDGDLVLLGGDMSWGMNIEEDAPDYKLVASLKGRKAVVKGNHDYYWSSLGKMRTAFPSFDFIQNNAYRYTATDASGENQKGIVLAGSRGWTIPANDAPEADKKIYARELIRLEMSLKAASAIKKENDILIVMLHYPPFEADYADTEMTKLIESYDADFALYGHLHGKNVRVNATVIKNNIKYILTSCDLVNNRLIEVCSL